VALLDPETVADRDMVAVFMTPKLGKARRVEALLTARGVDYTVQVELFGYTLFGSARHGAMFSVAADQAHDCRSALLDAGLGRGVVEEEPGA
jgi:hypothetical protein